MSEFKVAAVSNAAVGNNIKSPSEVSILVVGVGGGGCNALQHMINQSLPGVSFIAVNTDSVALSRNTSPVKVQIGVNLTHGLGSGCNPTVGRKAAEESHDDLKRLLQNGNLIFITAGMGGGTGTGAAPLIAEIAKKECRALTVGVVTKPFKFEGKSHMVNAQAGITELSKYVDSLIVIDNNKLLTNLGANVSILNAFNAANDVLYRAVFGINSIITNADYMNVDFNDVRLVMEDAGLAVVGIGHGKGPTFVEDAVAQAVRNPLIDNVDVRSATGIIVHTRVNPNFGIGRWQMINEALQKYVSEESDYGSKIGMNFDDKLAEDEIVVTIIMTGISQEQPGTQDSVRVPSALRRHGDAAPAVGGSDFFTQVLKGGTPTIKRDFSTSTPTQATATSTLTTASATITEVPNNGTESAAATAAEVKVAPPPAEIAVSGMSSSEGNGDESLWVVPPILRGRAD